MRSGEQRTGTVGVTNGMIEYDIAGNGPAVVLIHGGLVDRRLWDAQFMWLAGTNRVIRYDLRGFGRSSLPPPTEYAHEDDLNALLSSFGAAPAHVVGLSMGGRMALRFAAAYPQSVRSLALADSALDGQTWTEDWQKRWSGMCAAARAGQFADAKRRWLEHPLFDSARSDPSQAALLARMVEDYSGWHWHKRDSARAPSPPLAERLGEIGVRSLVITGERDIPDFQTVGDVLTRGLPSVQRSVIRGSGHMVNLEAPREFNAALLEFWRGGNK